MTRLLVAVALLLAAALPAGAAAVEKGGISVSDVWSRPALYQGVVYAVIHNAARQRDRLDRVAYDLAAAAEIHESTAMPGMSMGMRPVRSIPIEPGATLRLAPGGYHIMLIDLKGPLRAGRRVPVRLHFAHAGWITVRSEVR